MVLWLAVACSVQRSIEGNRNRTKRETKVQIRCDIKCIVPFHMQVFKNAKSCSSSGRNYNDWDCGRHRVFLLAFEENSSSEGSVGFRE